ncbi:hypothetical protein GCM10020331_012050 [Ectobacillus funiculus]
MGKYYDKITARARIYARKYGKSDCKLHKSDDKLNNKSQK